MKYFIQFKPNTDIHPKVMVIEATTKHEATEQAIMNYGKSVHVVVVSGSEITQTLGIVPFGTTVKYTEPDGLVRNFPIKSIGDSVKAILTWFQTIHPDPKKIPSKLITTQMGVHLEEVAEMLDALGERQEALRLSSLADRYKTMSDPEKFILELSESQKTALLDSLCDQAVTLLGIGYRMGFRMEQALWEVNLSNWSKFEDNKPVFDGNGKVIKGKNYFKPNLGQFLT